MFYFQATTVILINQFNPWVVLLSLTPHQGGFEFWTLWHSQWNTTTMIYNHYGIQLHWNTTSMEDNIKERQLQWKTS